MKIILEVPTAKLAEFKRGFLREHPLPLGVTASDHFAQVLKNFVFSSYRTGARRLAEDDASIDSDVLTVTIE
jgi:hypothetical protein